MKEQDSQSFCCLLLRCGSCLLFLHSEMSSNTAATQLYILTAETQAKINGRRLKFQALSYWRLGHQSRVQAKRVPRPGVAAKAMRSPTARPGHAENGTLIGSCFRIASPLCPDRSDSRSPEAAD